MHSRYEDMIFGLSFTYESPNVKNITENELLLREFPSRLHQLESFDSKWVHSHLRWTETRLFSWEAAASSQLGWSKGDKEVCSSKYSGTSGSAWLWAGQFLMKIYFFIDSELFIFRTEFHLRTRCISMCSLLVGMPPKEVRFQYLWHLFWDPAEISFGKRIALFVIWIFLVFDGSSRSNIIWIR